MDVKRIKETTCNLYNCNSKPEIIIWFDTSSTEPGIEIELCESCAIKLHNKLSKALDTEE